MYITGKLIKVSNDSKTDFFLKKTDVAKKFGFTPQQIGNILNGKTKKKYIVYDNLIYNIEYEKNDENIKKYIKQKKTESIVKDKNTEDTEDIKNMDGKYELMKDPYDYFIKFLNENIIKTNNKNDFLKIIDIYNEFICSSYFLDRDSSIKKKFFTYKNIKTFCQTDKNIGFSFKKKLDRMIDGERFVATNVLIGYDTK
jgi:hypothetical protein